LAGPRGLPGPGTNRILAMLPPDVEANLRRHCRPVRFELGQVILPQNGRIENAWFSTGAIFSAVVRMDDGRSVEAVPAGFEGMIGVAALLGETMSPYEVTVQGAGDALQITIPELLRIADQESAVHEALLRYAQVQMIQAARSAACNRLHDVEERLARWLLHMHDWVWSDCMRLTQEFLATMLGVRRASVTVAARTLQNAGLIKYARGEITILDRDGLESLACEDYFAIRGAFDRLLPLPQGG
jgi:CRP-like cAMP-binding protein